MLKLEWRKEARGYYKATWFKMTLSVFAVDENVWGYDIVGAKGLGSIYIESGPSTKEEAMQAAETYLLNECAQLLNS